jgi:hypothetical protein
MTLGDSVVHIVEPQPFRTYGGNTIYIAEWVLLWTLTDYVLLIAQLELFKAYRGHSIHITQLESQDTFR